MIFIYVMNCVAITVLWTGIQYCSAMVVMSTAEMSMRSMRQLVRKPTNSVTVRQMNASIICKNSTAQELVKNDKDCTKFFVCINNETIVEGVCPNNMYYNDKIKLCDIAANTICESKPDVDTGGNSDINMNLEIANATAYCITKAEVPNQIAFVGSSMNCNQYYICYHQRAILQECSENLHWNSFIGKCDKLENAGCTLTPDNSNNKDSHDSESIVMGNGKPTALPWTSNLINCPNDGEHIFPHMQNCDLFIYCYRGKTIMQQCPFYHHFDILSKSCQWRTKALCVRDVALNM